MFRSVRVIGHGRVGSALSARLRERGVSVDVDKREAELVLVCVPDSAIHDVAAGIEVGPWIAHVSGATALAALDPHASRFGLHPLQTFTRARGPEQLDGAWAAVTAETDAARTRGFWLADCLGLRPFEVSEKSRVLYHAGAAMAAGHVLAVVEAAARLLMSIGMNRREAVRALLPLTRQVLQNFERLGPRAAWTGPLARGDYGVVEAHTRALQNAPTEFSDAYEAVNRLAARVLAQDTAGTIAELDRFSGSKSAKAKATGGKA